MELRELQMEIRNINEMLYQQNMLGAFPKLGNVLPQLEKYITELDEDTRDEWLGILQSALNAMEKQDCTLLADILEYEVLGRMG